ncbi:MAG: hypothetical protein ACK2TV_00720 [Anaerolineales bacterium]
MYKKITSNITGYTNSRCGYTTPVAIWGLRQAKFAMLATMSARLSSSPCEFSEK